MSVDETAKRKWSDAYLVLTQAAADPPKEPLRGDFQGRLVNWIGAQSVPSLLPPYFAGSARSELLTLLEKGHQGVKLSREELDKLACWIDLLVPYCGDYREANAWTEEEMKSTSATPRSAAHWKSRSSRTSTPCSAARNPPAARAAG